MDVWGEKGRFTYLHGGLTLAHYPREANRAAQGENEIVHDRPVAIQSTLGEALYDMYGNLVDALRNGEPLFSPAASALETQAIIEAVIDSTKRDGQIVQAKKTSGVSK